MASSIAFIGGGNMAASLIGGLIQAGHPAALLSVAEPLAERRDWLARQFAGIRIAAQAAEISGSADALVLAVKPQQMHEALSGLPLRAGSTVVSIAAGIQLASLARWLGATVHLVRSMPNTPALLGAGISGLYADAAVPAAARELASYILRAAGSCVWVEREEQLDAVTAVSGSGPAYFFLITELMREAGVGLGLAPAVAADLALQTFIGAAKMAATGTDVAQLRANVTSKGGTTAAALQHLENAGLRTIFADALGAAARRSQELGEQLAHQN